MVTDLRTAMDAYDRAYRLWVFCPLDADAAELASRREALEQAERTACALLNGRPVDE